MEDKSAKPKQGHSNWSVYSDELFKDIKTAVSLYNGMNKQEINKQYGQQLNKHYGKFASTVSHDFDSTKYSSNPTDSLFDTNVGKLVTKMPTIQHVKPSEIHPLNVYKAFDKNEAKELFKSQKALGVYKLLNTYHLSNYDGFRYLNDVIGYGRVFFYPHDTTNPFHADFSTYLGYIKVPFFARPCPAKPRHGFIESRLIHNEEEWNALLKEIAESDEPDAEIILMPYVESEFSYVITKSGISFGPKNDGATSGQNAKFIPFPTNDTMLAQNMFSQDYSLFKDCGVKDSVYLEGLYTDNHPICVQVRDGPEQTTSTNHVPTNNFNVKKVLLAEGDLMKWEKQIKNAEPGTVVHHPDGVLCSHYAVHAIINKIPVICDSVAPEIGQTLQKTNGVESLKDNDYVKLAEQIKYHMLNPYKYSTTIHTFEKNIRNIGSFAVGTLHAQAQWGQQEHLLKLRAAALVEIIRIGAAIAFGEARHYYNYGPGKGGNIFNGHVSKYSLLHKNYNPVVQNIPSLANVSSTERSLIYLQLLQKTSFSDLLEYSLLLKHEFKTSGWVSGYGGKKWGTCCNVLFNLIKATVNFTEQPTEKNWIIVVQKWNHLVHVCHNNDTLLSKVVPNMTQLSTFPMGGFISSEVYSLLYSKPKKKQLETAAVFDIKPLKDSVPLLDKRILAWSTWREAALLAESTFASTIRYYCQIENVYNDDSWRYHDDHCKIFDSSAKYLSSQGYTTDVEEKLVASFEQFWNDFTQLPKSQQTQKNIKETIEKLLLKWNSEYNTLAVTLVQKHKEDKVKADADKVKKLTKK